MYVYNALLAVLQATLDTAVDVSAYTATTVHIFLLDSPTIFSPTDSLNNDAPSTQTFRYTRRSSPVNNNSASFSQPIAQIPFPIGTFSTNLTTTASPVTSKSRPSSLLRPPISCRTTCVLNYVDLHVPSSHGTPSPESLLWKCLVGCRPDHHTIIRLRLGLSPHSTIEYKPEYSDSRILQRDFAPRITWPFCSIDVTSTPPPQCPFGDRVYYNASSTTVPTVTVERDAKLEQELPKSDRSFRDCLILALGWHIDDMVFVVMVYLAAFFGIQDAVRHRTALSAPMSPILAENVGVTLPAPITPLTYVTAERKITASQDSSSLVSDNPKASSLAEGSSASSRSTTDILSARSSEPQRTSEECRVRKAEELRSVAVDLTSPDSPNGSDPISSSPTSVAEELSPNSHNHITMESPDQSSEWTSVTRKKKNKGWPAIRTESSTRSRPSTASTAARPLRPTPTPFQSSTPYSLGARHQMSKRIEFRLLTVDEMEDLPDPPPPPPTIYDSWLVNRLD